MNKFGIKIDWFIFTIRLLVVAIFAIVIMGLILNITKVEFPDVKFVQNYSIEKSIFLGSAIIIFLYLFSKSKWVNRKLGEYKNSADRSQIKIRLMRLVDQSYGVVIAIFIASLFYGCVFPNDKDGLSEEDNGSADTHTLVVWMHENCYR